MTKPWFPEWALAEPAQLQAVSSDQDAEGARAALLLTLSLAAWGSLIIPVIVDMRVKVDSFLLPLLLIPYCSLPWLYARWRQMRRIEAAIELLVLAMLVTFPVLIFSYSAMHLGFALVDEQLTAWDAALGFDALQFLQWLDRRPLLAEALRISYGSFFPQLLLLPVLLCARGQVERAYQMVLALLLLGIIGASTCLFFPAVGLYVYNDIPPNNYQHISQQLGYFHLQLNAARLDPEFALDLSQAAGIVAFPSGHAGAAVLCAAAAWRLRWLRWPFLLLNLGMFVSAIPQGAHYLVDLLAGAVAAAAAIRLSGELSLRMRPKLLSSVAPFSAPALPPRESQLPT